MTKLRTPGEPPAPPKQRKLWGTARTIDKVAAVRTEEEHLAYGRDCFAAGVKHGLDLAAVANRASEEGSTTDGDIKKDSGALSAAPFDPRDRPGSWFDWERDRHKTAELMRHADERNRTATRTNTRSAERPPKGRKT